MMSLKTDTLPGGVMTTTTATITTLNDSGGV